MNIKRNVWESNVTSRGEDASIFEKAKGGLFTPANFSNFQKNLELLNDRIYAIHKQLTYWDLYKITTSVNNSSDFEAIVAALAPGEACVINTNTFTTGLGDSTQSFSRGDVIVKTIDNELIYIPTINSGIYYPAKLSRGTSENVITYQLDFNYSKTMPSSGITSKELDQEVTNPTQTISFQDLGIVTADYIYGRYGDFTGSFTFDAVFDATDNTRPIYPIIKFFYNNEEISFEYTVTYTAIAVGKGSWTVTGLNYPSVTGVNFKYQVK